MSDEEIYFCKRCRCKLDETEYTSNRGLCAACAEEIEDGKLGEDVISE